MNRGRSEIGEQQDSHQSGQRDQLGHEHDMDNDEMDSILTQESADLIGRQLRKVYGDLVAEPLPDRFADLLNKLSAADKG